MDRRDALKALTGFAAVTGLTVAPVTTHEAQGVELVVLRVNGKISQEAALRLKALWLEATTGTALAQTKAVVLDDQLDVEFVRTKA